MAHISLTLFASELYCLKNAGKSTGGFSICTERYEKTVLRYDLLSLANKLHVLSVCTNMTAG